MEIKALIEEMKRVLGLSGGAKDEFLGYGCLSKENQ